MQLNRTAKYAIQTLGLMAKNRTQKYSARELSESLDIPYKYLTKIMTKLKNSDIVSSTKGKYGGFIILKELKDIKIIDIVIVFDDINNKKCILVDTVCNYEQKCIIHDKWDKPRCAIDDFFAQTTLLDLVEKED